MLFCAALFLHGYATHQIGHTDTPTAVTGEPAALDAHAALLDLGPDGWRSVAPADRTVALTFDDGPDPRWTPAVLDVLRRHGVHATFFVVGARVLEHPDLTRRVVDEGHEIGNHTFSHVEVGAISGWELGLQLSLTQTAVAGATGVRPVLFRPPYASTPDTVSVEALDGYRTRRRPRLPDRPVRLRQQGLATRRRRRHRRAGHPARHCRGRHPVPRRRRRPQPDASRPSTGSSPRCSNVATDSRRMSSFAGLPAGRRPTARRTDRTECKVGCCARRRRPDRVLASAMLVLLPLLGVLTLARTALLVWYARRHRRHHRDRPVDHVVHAVGQHRRARLQRSGRHRGGGDITGRQRLSRASR